MLGELLVLVRLAERAVPAVHLGRHVVQDRPQTFQGEVQGVGAREQREQPPLGDELEAPAVADEDVERREIAMQHLPAMQLAQSGAAARSRTFGGPLGTLTLSAKPEGGHYTFVEANTDQMGESRLDRNAKRFFVALHRVENPSHTLEASY